MIELPTTLLALGMISLVAATVNGALGYGFSPITVPLGLLLTTSRVLNPAHVLVEVGVNAYALAANKASSQGALRRVGPLALGVIPGVVTGSLVVASVSPELVKLATYLILLPLVLVQLGGPRRPLRAERALGLPVGAGIGLLYSATTISRPPLAIFLNNQGYVRRDFRAAIALVRLIESSLTALAYAFLGLFTSGSFGLVPALVPGVLVGVPLGVAVIRRTDAVAFRRLAMGFDALVVAFGLSRLLERIDLVRGPLSYAVLLVVVATLIVLFFRPLVRPTGAAGPATISGARRSGAFALEGRMSLDEQKRRDGA